MATANDVYNRVKAGGPLDNKIDRLLQVFRKGRLSFHGGTVVDGKFKKGINVPADGKWRNVQFNAKGYVTLLTGATDWFEVFASVTADVPAGQVLKCRLVIDEVDGTKTTRKVTEPAFVELDPKGRLHTVTGIQPGWVDDPKRRVRLQLQLTGGGNPLLTQIRMIALTAKP